MINYRIFFEHVILKDIYQQFCLTIFLISDDLINVY